jgi:hypothetical protein
LLAKVSGSIRFDAIDGERVEHWHVTLDRGTWRISRRNSKADAVVRGDHELFDAIFDGRENATAALLRGALIPEGDLGLLPRFERIFSARPPSDPVRPPATARGAR